ncbi:hypothetical protein PIB30_020296 [Stylosanthes scabra]|uniref:Uncharacterized protein n=1 Tax=Stylosanthes scabra TaxID=79078 RepID=A0ABU6VAV0_9FABA|nr:hypothetical protein [Stylosanthes scabra]
MAVLKFHPAPPNDGLAGYTVPSWGGWPPEIRRLAYRFQAVTPDDRLEYRPSWLSEDRHVWITFEVHRRIMQDRFIKFLAEVRHIGGSSGFRPYQVQADPVPINIVPPDYNSDEDSDYDDESSGHNTDEDELVLYTPDDGAPYEFPAFSRSDCG